ncbi:unnamed protein product [Orchesella dallaii]|uniref:Tudor domain-containing protein n=1 Tax=Orchesella dallaii TaxID=48710 RepID=A0ABP1QJ94_9HEXA
METEPIPVIREISRADIPNKCLAKVFWVDDNSYVYIGLFCPILQEEFHAAMAAATRGGPRLPSHVREGAHVIIMDADQVRNTYARGVVLKINHSNYTVKCLLIDECREIDVNCMKIYPTTNHVLSFPNFCIKGQLKDLECFIDCPFVKCLFKHHLESLGKTELDLGLCFMSISNPLQQTPTLEITFPGQESTLNSTLQNYIPSLGKMNYPPVAAVTKMALTYVSTDGDVWVQEYSNFSLINVVKKLLAGFDPKRSPQLAYQVTDEDCASWKEPYFFGEGRMFVAKHCSDGKFHRVKVNPGNDAVNGPTVTVFYVDYGHDDVVERKNLHAAYLIDPNLCFIPPQVK